MTDYSERSAIRECRKHMHRFHMDDGCPECEYEEKEPEREECTVNDTAKRQQNIINTGNNRAMV